MTTVSTSVSNGPELGRTSWNTPRRDVCWMPPEARLNDITRRHIHLGWRYSSNMHDAPPGDMFGAVVAKSAWRAVGDRLGRAWVNKTYSTGQQASEFGGLARRA